jgi:hypothetical protein
MLWSNMSAADPYRSFTNLAGASLKRLLPLLLVLISGCDDAYEKNSEYMKDTSARFESGQAWADVKERLSELGDDDVELYNPCTEGHGDETIPCPGYQLIANIPLPHEHPSAGGATG